MTSVKIEEAPKDQAPKSLNVTFTVTNPDPSDKHLKARQEAIKIALNELSYPEDGSKPVNQLGVHGASVHVDFDHLSRHAQIDVRGAMCSNGCTRGTVGSAQSITDHFNAVVVPKNILKTFVVSVGGQTLNQLIEKHGPALQSGCGLGSFDFLNNPPKPRQA